MTIRCINPGCFSSGSRDAGPPEYESDNSVDCCKCDREIDLDDDTYTKSGEGNYICEGCAEAEDEDIEDE